MTVNETTLEQIQGQKCKQLPVILVHSLYGQHLTLFAL